MSCCGVVWCRACEVLCLVDRAVRSGFCRVAVGCFFGGGRWRFLTLLESLILAQDERWRRA